MSVFLLGLVVWFGLPTVLQPVERLSRSLGAELNNLPGYVDLKHSITGLESDDWIALDEGAWFYMPTLYPAASFSQAMQILQTQDVLIRQIPEVANVLGKIGRVESALDPAPTAMIETYVMLKPRSEWREGVTSKDIWNEISRVATLPGVTPASPLQPIEGRVVMLQSGIKAAMAIRIYGDDLDGLAKASRSVAEHLKQSPFVNASTVNPDIVMGKPYIEFEVDRESAGRFEMSVAAVNQIIETALGGMNVTTTVEGRERYSIRVRYQRDLRERIEDLRRLPIVTNSGQIVPLEKLAHMKTTWGPAAINSENGRMVAHVSFATSGIAGDLESVQAIETSLREAQKRAVEGRGTNGSRVEGRGSRDKGVEGRGSRDEGKPAPALDPRPSSLDLLPSLDLPSGYVLTAVGSFQNQIEANHRLMWMVPLVMLINLLIIYLQFRNLPMTLAVFAGIPVSFGGGMIMLGLFGVPMNTATWIGFIALFGIAVDDGVIMATYLDQVYKRRRPRTIPELRDATVEAGLRRIRPCLMTTVTTLVALIPILISTGRGADVARAMALPVFGGMLFELIRLFGVPLSICAYKEFKLRADKTELHIEQSDTVDSVELPIVRAA
jgi:Cu(I)/Ag(I) efflux system membrane protein CusA/SilA